MHGPWRWWWSNTAPPPSSCYSNPFLQLTNSQSLACGAALCCCNQTCHMCADTALLDYACSRATLPSPTTPSLQRTAQWPTTLRSAVAHGAGQTRAARTSSPTCASCLVSCLAAAAGWCSLARRCQALACDHCCLTTQAAWLLQYPAAWWRLLGRNGIMVAPLPDGLLRLCPQAEQHNTFEI